MPSEIDAQVCMVAKSSLTIGLTDPGEWLLPMLAYLETNHIGRSMGWLVDSTYLAAVFSRWESAVQIGEHSSEIKRLVQIASPVDLSNIGRQLWYTPGRDLSRTVVAKMYESAAILSGGNTIRYARRFVAPLCLFAEADERPVWKIAFRNLVVGTFLQHALDIADKSP